MPLASIINFALPFSKNPNFLLKDAIFSRKFLFAKLIRDPLYPLQEWHFVECLIVCEPAPLHGQGEVTSKQIHVHSCGCFYKTMFALLPPVQ